MKKKKIKKRSLLEREGNQKPRLELGVIVANDGDWPEQSEWFSTQQNTKS